MDVCDPNISYEDLKKRVEQDVGRTLNMSRKQICNLYANIRQDKLLLPPMVLSKDRTYMTDKKSPLTQADYERLFDKSTLKAQIKRLATKVQALVEEKNTKDELREAIFSRLRTMGVREPVRFAAGTKKPKQTMSAPANFGMNRVNNNVNTVNRVNNTVNTVNRVNNNVNNVNRVNTVNRVNNTVNTVNRVNNNVNNVNRVNNNVNNVNRVNNTTRRVNNRQTVFKRGFVPEFIKQRREQPSAPAPRPVLAAPTVQVVNRPAPTAPVLRLQRNANNNNNNSDNNNGKRPVLKPASFIRRREEGSSPSSDKRKELQRHLDTLKDLSVEDINGYYNNLAANRMSVKDIKSRSERQNEMYKRKKKEILDRLKAANFTTTQKNIYRARLNAIPRGTRRSYLDNIQQELLKDIERMNTVKRRAELRKQLGGKTGDELDTVYKNTYNRVKNLKDRKLLNEIYNSVKRRPPRVNTNENVRRMKEVVSRLNQNKREEEIRQLSQQLQAATASLASATRSGNIEQASQAQSKITTLHNQRIRVAENTAQSLANAAQSTNDVNLITRAEKAEAELEALKKAKARAPSESAQIKERSNAAAKFVENTPQSVALDYGVDVAYIRQYMVGKSMKNLNRNTLALKIAADKEVADLTRTRLRFIPPSMYDAALANAKKALSGKRNAKVRKETIASERQERRKLANASGVSLDYLDKYLAGGSLNSLNKNAFRAKIEADKKVSNLLGSKTVAYIAPVVYNDSLRRAEKAKDDKDIKALARDAGVSASYVVSYLQDKNVSDAKNVNKSDFMNKVKKDKALAEAERRRTGLKQRVLGNNVRYVPQDEFNVRTLLAKNKNIPAPFTNAFLKNTGRNVKSLKENNAALVSAFGKAKDIQKYIGGSLVYLNSDEKYAKAIVDAKKKAMAREAKVSSKYVQGFLNAQNKNFLNQNGFMNTFKSVVEENAKTRAAEVAATGGGKLTQRLNRMTMLYTPVDNKRKAALKSQETTVAFIKNLSDTAEVSEAVVRDYIQKNPDLTNLEAYMKKFFKNTAVNKVKKIVSANIVDKFLTNNKTEVRSPFLVMNGRRLNVPEVKKVQEITKAQAKELKASNIRRKKQENIRVKNLAQKYRVGENFIRGVDMNENKVREERKRLNTNRRQQLIKDYLKIQTTPTNAQERTALNSVAVRQADKYAKIYGKNSKQIEKDISDILKKMKTDEIFFMDPTTNKNRIPKMLNLKYGINRTGITNDLKTLKTLSDEEKKILETSVVKGVPGALNKAKKVNALRRQIRALKGLSKKNIDDYIQLAGSEPAQLEKVVVIARAAAEMLQGGDKTAVSKLGLTEGQVGRSIRNKSLNDVKQYVNSVKQVLQKKETAIQEVRGLRGLPKSRQDQYIKDLQQTNDYNRVLFRAFGEHTVASLNNMSGRAKLRESVEKVKYDSGFRNAFKKLLNAAKGEAVEKRKEANAKKAQEEANGKAKEEANRKAAKEEANRKAAKEEANRKAKEEANRKAKEEANRKAKEEANRKAAKEEANRKAAEAEAKKKAAKEEANRKAAKEEANRKAAEAESRKKKAAEAEARKKKAAEAEARKKAAKESNDEFKDAKASFSRSSSTSSQKSSLVPTRVRQWEAKAAVAKANRRAAL